MKTMKYFVIGAMMLSMSAPAMAQDVKAQVDAITKVVVDAKGDVAATKAQVKEFMKLNKKDAEAVAGLGRAFMNAKNLSRQRSTPTSPLRLARPAQLVTFCTVTSQPSKKMVVRQPCGTRLVQPLTQRTPHLTLNTHASTSV